MLQALPEFQALRERHADLLTPPSRITQLHPPSDTNALPSREVLSHVMRTLFETYDILCCPTMAHPAPAVPDHWGTPYPNPFMGTDFTFIANTVGCAAASVPCGLVRGLPVGLQVIAPPGDEATALRVSRAAEVALGVFPRLITQPSAAMLDAAAE
jgi:Asp-tRNA(Asn)/Glu-tRNA(Gln) amidotransferase A subunit family amidase